MKLVVFGLTVSSSWGNGHATLWRGLCAALARRGHEVAFFERDVPYYAHNRDLPELPARAPLSVPRLGGDRGAGAAPPRGRRRGDGHVLLPGRRCRGRAGARGPDAGPRVLRPRHAGDARPARGRPEGRLPAAAGPGRLRPRPQLHRRRRPRRARRAPRRPPRGSALRQRRSRRVPAGRADGALPRRPLLHGHLRRSTGRRGWSSSWSSRPGACPTGAS